MNNYDKTLNFLKKLPNKLTIARIAAIPILMLLYPIDYLFFRVLCAVIFLAAASTDFFDGYIARRYHAVTSLGKLLDPVADKLLITATLILLVGNKHIYAWLAAVLICRDIFITGLRLIALENNFSVEVNYYGKLKTFFNIVAIANLIVYETIFQIPFRTIGMIFIWITLIFSLYSGYTYWLAFKKHYDFHENEE